MKKKKEKKFYVMEDFRKMKKKKEWNTKLKNAELKNRNVELLI